MKAVVRISSVVAGALMLVAPAVAQTAEPTIAELKQLLDFVWVLCAAALVFFMQVGFLLLEAGMVRSKNSINVALKNVLDFVFSALAFCAIGFMISFGAGTAFGVGFDPRMFMLGDMDPAQLVFFVFQVMFCGTAATIVSGAVAERMKLSAYVLGSIVMGGLIYPVFVHWAWGAGMGPNSGAFLGNMGFVDFAGSTVVHSTGAWLSLAACVVMGARRGRFAKDGTPIRFAGHSPVLSAAGTLVLFVGWIGFNGGSTLAASGSIAHIIVNTVVAGSAGGAIGLVYGVRMDRIAYPEKSLCGLIGGLVAVTAGCNALDTTGSIIIGAVGGWIAIWGNDLMERRFKIDDAVGAIGVHGFAGVTGTLGLALLAPVEHLPAGDRWVQLGIQAMGSGLNFVWAFGAGFIFFKLLQKVMGLRVDSDAEERGLNEAEHGTRLGVGHVEDALTHLVKGTADLGLRLEVDPGDEAERLTRTFNALMDNVQREQQARTEASDQQRTSEEAERLSALADATFEGLCISVDGEIIDGNAALGRLLGADVNVLRGCRLADFIAEEDASAIEELTTSADARAREVAVLDVNGDRIPVEARGRDIMFRGVKTRVLAIVDLRERKQAEERIRHLALHDPLTGLPNRGLFNERLQDMIGRTVREGLISAVILVDLDRFKDVNDLYGHGAGDQVLTTVTERLRGLVQNRDFVARLGGDEFAILQIDIDFPNQAADLALRVIEEVNKPITLSDGNKVRVGASIGFAICPRDGIEGVRLVTRADTALYHAKSKGRNRYAMFEEGMDEDVRRRQLLELDLAAAIEHNQFELHYQPRMNMKDGHIGSYEALIRWRHPQRGLISPAEFIPVAEGSGRIVKIGEWVLRAACFAAATQLNGARVSVNASPMQFRDRNFIETVRAAIRDANLAPSRLEIEITESVLIEDDERALGVFQQLKQIGVRIALDDFGTGYSSLGYLSRFPFDSIKIDRSFVRGLGKDGPSLAIIETIIRLGRALDMTIVAEGVEAGDELALLAARGCDEVQGYLVGQPQPMARLVRQAPAEVMSVLATEEALSALKSTIRRYRDDVAA